MLTTVRPISRMRSIPATRAMPSRGRPTGYLFYSDYLEVVLWTNGINVWKLWKDEDGEVKIRNLLRLNMPLEKSVIHDVSIEIQKDRFVIQVDDLNVELYCGDIYEQFHLGITGCEGPCRFYDMEIERL